jgi:predicted heme/steroid binding protein
MKLIKLTSHSDDSPIYININEIGHIYEVKQSDDWFEGKPIAYWFEGKPIVEKFTRVGVTTHNDGFRVKETPEKIIEKIKIIKNANSTRTI